MSPEVVRSEEQVRFDTRRRTSARFRVGKRIVTEEQTFTVAVRREELFIEELSVGDDSPTADDGGPTVIELVLRREEVSFTTDIVPVERVRVIREARTELQEAGARVRAERIDLHTVAAFDGAQPGQEFWPIADYDRLRVSDIAPLLAQLDGDGLDEIERLERGGKARVAILRRLEELRAALS